MKKGTCIHPVEEWADLLESGVKYREIAERYGVTIAVVGNAIFRLRNPRSGKPSHFVLSSEARSRAGKIGASARWGIKTPAAE